MNLKSNKFVNDLSVIVKNNSRTILLVILLILVLVGGVVIYKAVRNSAQPVFPLMGDQPEILATPSLGATGDTSVPVASAEWTVFSREENVVENGFEYAVATFKNVGDGSFKKAQCQVPKWDFPPLGTVYILTNTTGDIWFFFPQNQREQTATQKPLQYFAPIP